MHKLKRYRKQVIWGILFLFFYTAFWVWFFHPEKSIRNFLDEQFSNSGLVKDNKSLVLGTQVVEDILPPSYEIEVVTRKQFYNLSCEFASAVSIISSFTQNPEFAVSNEANAEKILINKVVQSKNPNIGLRMGEGEDLYTNLNKQFGGSDYYGIHAAPFFDIFKSYKLISRPIYNDNQTVFLIQKAISSGHLVMAWIKIGYAQPIDDALAYGKTKIIKGEHAIVLTGYDKQNFIVMDPAVGAKRYIPYLSLINASKDFDIPFLEVYPGVKKNTDDLIVGIDTPTDIDRNIPKILVENGSGNVGVANQMWGILKDFGYNVVGINNAKNFNYKGVGIFSKPEFSDYLILLKKDIGVASFAVSTSSANLLGDNPSDVIVIVGK